MATSLIEQQQRATGDQRLPRKQLKGPLNTDDLDSSDDDDHLQGGHGGFMGSQERARGDQTVQASSKASKFDKLLKVG